MCTDAPTPPAASSATQDKLQTPRQQFLIRYELRDGECEYCIRFLADTDELRDLLPDLAPEFSSQLPDGQCRSEEALQQWEAEGYIEIEGGLRAIIDIGTREVPPEEAEIARKYLYY